MRAGHPGRGVLLRRPIPIGGRARARPWTSNAKFKRKWGIRSYRVIVESLDCYRVLWRLECYRTDLRIMYAQNMFMSTYKIPQTGRSRCPPTPACFVEQYPMPLSEEHNIYA